MLLKAQQLIAITSVACLTAALAAAPVIGVVKANGSFLLDNVKVWGNSTLLDGHSIETLEAPSQVQLNSGARLILVSNSRSRVYNDRMVLEKGGSQLKGAADYAIETANLRVRPAGPDAAVFVVLDGADGVQVEALKGRARVSNSQGVLVADLAAGTALVFNAQKAGAAAPSQLRGCLERKDSVFLLTDTTTQVVVQLQGTGLDAQVGNVIEITGVTIPGAEPAAGATQVIQVSDLKATGEKCGVPAAAPPAAAPAGLSTAAKVTIIGGLVVGATVGGLYAAGVFGEEEIRPPASP